MHCTVLQSGLKFTNFRRKKNGKNRKFSPKIVKFSQFYIFSVINFNFAFFRVVSHPNRRREKKIKAPKCKKRNDEKKALFEFYRRLSVSHTQQFLILTSRSADRVM